MKTITKFTILVLSIIFMTCKNNSDKSMKSSENNIEDKLLEFGNKYNDAWNSQKPENVASYYAPDGSLTVNGGTPVIGREQLTIFTKGFMESFPDLKLTMDSLVSKNGRTEFHWTFVGTNTGPNGTGNPVNFSGFESWILNEQGLIQESIGTYDADEYNRQVSGQVNQ